jgi:lipoteichoic acid synthase
MSRGSSPFERKAPLQRIRLRFPEEELLRPGALTLTFVLFFLLYRSLLWWKLVFLPMPPRGFVAKRYAFHEYLGATGWDLLTVAVLVAPSFIAFFWKRSRESERHFSAFGALLLLVVAFLCGVHLRMLFDRGEPLGVAAFHELSSGALTAKEILSYIAPLDLVLVLSPLVLYWVVLKSLEKLTSTGRRRIVVVLFALAVATALCAFGHHRRGFPKSIHHNPLQYAGGELARGLLAGPSALKGKARPLSPAQSKQMRHRDSQLVSPRKKDTVLEPPAPSDKRWNVVWIVMESTGRRYIDQKAPDGAPIMPHLTKIREESWEMTRHYSTSNSSHRSLFSLFSGLYPSFGPSIFCITPRVAVPTIRDFLPDDYEMFLYTAAQLKSYFPLAMLHNSGFMEVKGEADLRTPTSRPGPSYALNELDAAEAFARRVGEAKEPFLGIYYSYAPHYYYKDYGPEFRVMPDEQNLYHRYLNNLRVLDTALEIISDSLKQKGLWDRTVLVLVGDHGEAFGQHGFATHANDTHDEQVHVPWIVRVPGAPARKVGELTSHVDVVPTLLDLLHVDADLTRLQGESLIDEVSERRYVFFIGNEETANSVSREGVKVQHIYRGDRCRAFELGRDPEERSELSCDLYPEQDQALADFAAHQIRALPEYNRRFLKRRSLAHLN